MKRKLLCTLSAIFIAVSMLAGCGSSKTASMSSHKSADVSKSEETYFAAEAYDADVGEWVNDESISMDYTSDVLGDMGNGLKTVAPEMLVYRCTLGIDTTEFDKTLTNLRAKIAEYGGFVEQETLTDNCYSSSDYIVSKDDRLRSFSATIRIPSDKYADFVGCAEGLGIVNSKNAYVEDVTQTYGTLATTLAIYEADYKMYLEQYDSTTDQNTRILLQQEIRDLAIEIASIKTSMSSIENDVAYSYVTIYIDEYLVIPTPEPEPEPEPDPTFGQRLKEECKESWEDFLEFCEDLLFFIIDTWWGFAIFLIIAFIIFLIVRLIIKICKNAIRKSAIKREVKAEEYRKKLEEQAKKRQEEAAKAEAAKTEVKSETKPEANSGDAKKSDKK